LWSLAEEYILKDKNYLGAFKGMRGVVASVLVKVLPRQRFLIKTCLPMNGERIFNYNYDFTSTTQVSEDFNNKVLLVGSPFVDCNIVKKSAYMEYLNSILVKEKKDGGKVYYIPHRRESESLLNEISGLGFCIYKISMPIELFMINSKNIKKLVAFNSAAIFNISSFNLSFSCFYYDIPEADVSEGERESMRKAYDLISKRCERYEK